MSNVPVQKTQAATEQAVFQNQPLYNGFLPQTGLTYVQPTGFIGSQAFVPQVSTAGLLPQTLISPLTYGGTTSYGYTGQTTILPPVAQTTQVVSGASQIIGQSQMAGSYTGQTIKGESRIEYIPYEKSYVEYEEVRRQVQVPITRQVTDYQVIQYDIEYIPNVIQEKEISYVPVERIAERVEYQAIQKQNILSYPQYNIQTAQTVVQQPIIQQQFVTEPVISQAYAIEQQPLIQQAYATTAYQQPLVIQPTVQSTFIKQASQVQPQVAYQTYTQIPTQLVQTTVPGFGQSGLATTQILPGQPTQLQTNITPGTLNQNGTLNPQSKIVPTNQQVTQDKEKKPQKNFLDRLFD